MDAAPATIESLSNFLKFGPTGLAGLMLTLVIIALGVGTLNAGRERLLKQFMYIGAACFALSLAANFFAVAGAYPMYFRVLPLDMGATRSLPRPIIKVNNTPVEEKYVVKSEVTAIVDVSDAINFVQEFRLQNNRQRDALRAIVSSSDAILSDLQRVPQMLDRNCPGGQSGMPAASNPAVLAITSRATSTIAGFRASGSAAIAAPPPEVK